MNYRAGKDSLNRCIYRQNNTTARQRRKISRETHGPKDPQKEARSILMAHFPKKSQALKQKMSGYVRFRGAIMVLSETAGESRQG